MTCHPEPARQRMMTMADHARKGWTIPQALLGTACGALGIAIAILGFLDIYLTVTHLLGPTWGDWSWTVIVLGEGSFAGCYLGWLLLVLRDRPPTRTRAFPILYMTTFGALSLVLNLYAGWGTIPGVASHAIVVAAFFGYLLFVKVLIHRLSADPAARALDEELADARRHAVDLVRDRCGITWRLTAPRLLRRQITSGRFPHAVTTAVRESLKEFGPSWEPAVGTWVADALAVRVKAEVLAESARQDITRRASEAIARAALPVPIETPLAEPAEDAPRDTPQKAPADAPQKPPGSALRRVRRLGGRKATDDDLREAIRELFTDGDAVTKYRVVKELPIGEKRADRLLAEVQTERPSLAEVRNLR
jgi:hypothetical protein